MNHAQNNDNPWEPSRLPLGGVHIYWHGLDVVLHLVLFEVGAGVLIMSPIPRTMFPYVYFSMLSVIAWTTLVGPAFRLGKRLHRVRDAVWVASLSLVSVLVVEGGAWVGRELSSWFFEQDYVLCGQIVMVLTSPFVIGAWRVTAAWIVAWSLGIAVGHATRRGRDSYA